jgi:hypothetical protein
MKYFILSLFAVCSYVAVQAQIDTISFPEERAALRTLLHQREPKKSLDCSDMIAVGPKGDMSFSQQQWRAAQGKLKLIFKSVDVVPGSEYIRIYDGNMAVVNLLADVKLIVDGHDVNIKVRRLEVYHKSNGSWCRVAGQGTEVDEKIFPVKSNDH